MTGNKSSKLSFGELITLVWPWLCFCRGKHGHHCPHLRGILQGSADLGRSLIPGDEWEPKCCKPFWLGCLSSALHWSKGLLSFTPVQSKGIPLDLHHYSRWKTVVHSTELAIASQLLQQSFEGFLTLLEEGRSTSADPDSSYVSIQLHSTHQAGVQKWRPRSHSMFGIPYRTLPAEFCSTQGFPGRSDLVRSGSQCLDTLHAFHVSCECYLKFSQVSVIHGPLNVLLVSNMISSINFQTVLKPSNLQFACSLSVCLWSFSQKLDVWCSQNMAYGGVLSPLHNWCVCGLSYASHGPNSLYSLGLWSITGMHWKPINISHQVDQLLLCIWLKPRGCRWWISLIRCQSDILISEPKQWVNTFPVSRHGRLPNPSRSNLLLLLGHLLPGITRFLCVC